MKTLHLILKAQWYNMIEQGIKKEEYREDKDYWKKRLCRYDYDAVCFHYGYTSRTMTFEIENLRFGTGNPEWGAKEGKRYFVIKLGERLI